jgi:hypothetical protein
MDGITAAIVAALVAGASSGITDAAKVGINEAYQGLKGILQKKFGNDSHIVKSMDTLEEKPASAGRQQSLAEEVADGNIEHDPEIMQAIQQMMQLIQAQPEGEHLVQNVTGNYNAVVQGTGNATVNVNGPEPLA